MPYELYESSLCIIAPRSGYTFVYPSDTLASMTLKTKDAGLRLRVEKSLRQEFVDACRAEGRAAAEVLREFMRAYVAQNRGTAQRDLFPPSSSRESIISSAANKEVMT